MLICLLNSKFGESKIYNFAWCLLVFFFSNMYMPVFESAMVVLFWAKTPCSVHMSGLIQLDITKVQPQYTTHKRHSGRHLFSQLVTFSLEAFVLQRKAKKLDTMQRSKKTELSAAKKHSRKECSYQSNVAIFDFTKKKKKIRRLTKTFVSEIQLCPHKSNGLF